MSRKARRRGSNIPRGSAHIGINSLQSPTVVPEQLLWWPHPWATAHFSPLCPRFVREWAGVGHRPRQGNRNRAIRECTGMCPICHRVLDQQYTQRNMMKLLSTGRF